MKIKKYGLTLLLFLIYQFIFVIKPLMHPFIFFIMVVLYIVVIVSFSNTISSTKQKLFLSMKDLKDCLFFIPLLLLVITNGLSGVKFSIEYSLLCAISVIIEELFFRDIILKLLSDEMILKRVLISSALFALFHMTNQYEVVYLTYQILLSFFVGISLCMVTIKSQSIISAIIIHFLINISANGSILVQYQYVYVVFVLINILYSVYLYRRIMEEKE